MQDRDIFHDSGFEYQNAKAVGSKMAASLDHIADKPEMVLLLERFETVLDALGVNSSRLRLKANDLMGSQPEMPDASGARPPVYSALSKLGMLVERLADINSDLDDTAARFSRAI